MEKRKAVWQAIEQPRIEYIVLKTGFLESHRDDEGDHVASRIWGIPHRNTYDLRYRIYFYPGFIVRYVALGVYTTSDDTVRLLTDGRGNWTDDSHIPLPQLKGCFDVDISATPFTNTLPIRRIDWQVGQSEILNMVYIDADDLSARADQQRYTCLEKSSNGARFRFEQLSSGFTAELPVDVDGLVLDYPGLFKRVR